MDIKKMSDMKGGWFVGNFEPTLLKTDQFEVALHEYKKDEVRKAHYHAIATEYNYLVRGKMKINDQELNEGDLFIIYPNEIAAPEYITDCIVVIVKTPSVPTDKYEVDV